MRDNTSDTLLTPGPGSYSAIYDYKQKKPLQQAILEKETKKVGFGSQAERKTEMSLI